MSPRPKRLRMIEKPPLATGFKPVGVPMRGSEPVELHLEEFEAFRLADYEMLNQEAGAEKMGVSRPTFTRIYDSALKKMAKAVVEGKPLVISGGNATMEQNWYRCKDCDHLFHQEGEEHKCTTCDSEKVEHVNAALESWKCAGRGRQGQGFGRQRSDSKRQGNGGNASGGGHGRGKSTEK